MATDGPDPTPCDDELYKQGEVLMVVDTAGACSFETWAVELREKSEMRVDWHYVGGRAVVRYLGDRASLEKVARSLPMGKHRVLSWGVPL